MELLKDLLWFFGCTERDLSSMSPVWKQKVLTAYKSDDWMQLHQLGYQLPERGC